MKNIPGAQEHIEQSAYCIAFPGRIRGKWSGRFAQQGQTVQNAPLHIEIGMGKGRFLLEQAKTRPEINFLGIEKYSSVLVRGVEKQEEAQLQNLLFVRMEAELLEAAFAPGEVSRIYLNFSDPWPKERHAKRRLTSGDFLRRYARILAGDGTIEFKTDNTALFDFSLEALSEAGWTVLAATRDLHRDPDLNRDNVMTEYEARFSGKGNPICKLIAAPCRQQ